MDNNLTAIRHYAVRLQKRLEFPLLREYDYRIYDTAFDVTTFKSSIVSKLVIEQLQLTDYIFDLTKRFIYTEGAICTEGIILDELPKTVLNELRLLIL
ncbi:MAG: hypothetical protein DRG78_15385 [Epsilonproteobacteria bacterium]|nr:MAG: hypothetical protein DRG78_15385 [Campylobacterota bacterium]